MATDLRTLHEPLVEWVYDQADTPLEEVVLTPFAEENGLDLYSALQLLRYSHGTGLLEDHSTMGEASASLTPFGSEWVEQRRRRRADPAIRAAYTRSSLLTWLWGRKHEGVGMAVVSNFLEDPRSLFEGERLTQNDTGRAAAHLQAKGLIKGAGNSWGSNGLLRADITAEGEDCVENYDGDLAAYERRNNNGTTFNIGSNTGNIAANSRQVTQNATTNQGINPAEVVLFARSLRQAAPILGLPEGDDEEFVDYATRIENEAAAETPDRSRIQRWGSAIVGILNSPAVSGALAQTLATQAQAVLSLTS